MSFLTTLGNPSFTIDQGTVTDGIGNNTIGLGGRVMVPAPTGAQLPSYDVLNTRANLIQGCAYNGETVVSTKPFNGYGKGNAGVTGVLPVTVLPNPSIQTGVVGATGLIPTITVTRRYQVQLALGLLTQEKLIPTKYMASQLAIELTLDTPANCIIANMGTNWNTASNWQSAITYAVHNVNLIPEILEFDASYDTAFLQGLQNGGVPIKFCSWFLKKAKSRHTFLFSSALSNNVNLLIQERSRSVKSIFTVQRLGQPDLTVDNGATFFDSTLYG